MQNPKIVKKVDQEVALKIIIDPKEHECKYVGTVEIGELEFGFIIVLEQEFPSFIDNHSEELAVIGANTFKIYKNNFLRFEIKLGEHFIDPSEDEDNLFKLLFIETMLEWSTFPDLGGDFPTEIPTSVSLKPSKVRLLKELGCKI